MPLDVMLKMNIYLLGIINLMAIAGAVGFDTKNATETSMGTLYMLNDENNSPNNTGYERKSIIAQLEDVSKVQCSLKCNKREGCNHVVVCEAEKRCKLLKEVVSEHQLTLYEKLDDGELIFSRASKF